MTSLTINENVINLESSIRCLKPLFTKIRNVETDRVEFCRYSKRLMTIICEEGLTHLDHSENITVKTPTGSDYSGIHFDPHSLVAVSVVRAGDSMLDTFLNIVPEAAVGKILIQRNEETAEPILFYCKLPSLLNKKIVLLDPMLATGGSAKCAIKVLLENGALEENITFFNVLACPEGIEAITTAYPKMKIVTGEIDPSLNEKRYIIPGLGDFGDRFYGTK